VNKILLQYLRKFPIEYGKTFLIKKIPLANKEEWVKYKNGMGVTFNLNLSEYQMRLIYLLDLYEKNTVFQLKKLIEKTTYNGKVTCIDVGANIGFYSLTVASIFRDKECSVHAFEPNSYTYSLLKENVLENQKNNIILNQIGLADRNDSFTLSYYDGNLGAANIYSKISNNFKTQTIKTTTLDEYCNRNGIESTEIIKVDIEGGELDFFRGASNIISKSKKCILIVEIIEEHCQRAGYSADNLFDHIIKLGFDAYLPKAYPFKLKKVNAVPSNYCDNIIFVKKGN